MKNKSSQFTCPNCDSTKILVTEESTYELNSMKFYCHSVKAHDSNAKVRCEDCSWEGERKQLSKE